MIARKRKGAFGHRSFDDFEPFNESINTNFGGVVGDTHLLVVADHPASTNTKFEPSVGQHIHSGEFFGENYGVLVVVVPHQGTNTEIGGDIGSGHERRNRCQLIVKVIGHREARIALIFAAMGEVDP